MIRPQFVAGLLLAALTSACTAAAPTPTDTPTATDTALPTATQTATATPTATVTDTPTATETATLTPTNLPTRKPRTATPTASGSETATTTGQPTSAAPSATPQSAPATTQPAGDNFAPTVAQVWNLDRDPFAKSSTDACGGDLPVDFYGLIGVKPDGDNLVWHRQDGNDYTLVKLSLNHYAGSGPSSVQDYNLSISIAFTSATTLVASHTLTSISNPDCKHTYKYNAVFKWNS